MYNLVIIYLVLFGVVYGGQKQEKRKNTFRDKFWIRHFGNKKSQKDSLSAKNAQGSNPRALLDFSNAASIRSSKSSSFDSEANGDSEEDIDSALINEPVAQLQNDLNSNNIVDNGYEQQKISNILSSVNDRRSYALENKNKDSNQMKGYNNAFDNGISYLDYDPEEEEDDNSQRNIERGRRDNSEDSGNSSGDVDQETTPKANSVNSTVNIDEKDLIDIKRSIESLTDEELEEFLYSLSDDKRELLEQLVDIELEAYDENVSKREIIKKDGASEYTNNKDYLKMNDNNGHYNLRANNIERQSNDVNDKNFYRKRSISEQGSIRTNSEVERVKRDKQSLNQGSAVYKQAQLKALEDSFPSQILPNLSNNTEGLKPLVRVKRKLEKRSDIASNGQPIKGYRAENDDEDADDEGTEFDDDGFDDRTSNLAKRSVKLKQSKDQYNSDKANETNPDSNQLDRLVTAIYEMAQSSMKEQSDKSAIGSESVKETRFNSDFEEDNDSEQRIRYLST